jgi:hypothetical protein
MSLNVEFTNATLMEVEAAKTRQTADAPDTITNHDQQQVLPDQCEVVSLLICRVS